MLTRRYASTRLLAWHCPDTLHQFDRLIRMVDCEAFWFGAPGYDNAPRCRGSCVSLSEVAYRSMAGETTILPILIVSGPIGLLADRYRHDSNANRRPVMHHRARLAHSPRRNIDFVFVCSKRCRNAPIDYYVTDTNLAKLGNQEDNNPETGIAKISTKPL